MNSSGQRQKKMLEVPSQLRVQSRTLVFAAPIVLAGCTRIMEERRYPDGALWLHDAPWSDVEVANTSEGGTSSCAARGFSYRCCVRGQLSFGDGGADGGAVLLPPSSTDPVRCYQSICAGSRCDWTPVSGDCTERERAERQVCPLV